MLIIQAIDVFLIFIETLVLMYMITSWIAGKTFFNKKLEELLSPFLGTIRWLLKKSVLMDYRVDFSPFVLLIILTSIEKFIYMYV